MAEERNLVPSGAPETAAPDTDATKQELQRRMEEAREQITQTVTEIKETVVNQYQQVRTSINDSLDWREQFRRRPVPFAAGAFGAGLLLGYAVAGSFGDDEDDYDEDDASFDRIESGFDQLRADTARKPYAASPILGQAASFVTAEATMARGGGHDAARGSADVGPETRPSYSDEYRPAVQTPESSAGGGSGQGGVGTQFGSFGSAQGGGTSPAAEEEPKGPSLFARFKETKAYDRLQDELTTVGERVVDELSRTAQTVVIPALLARLKDMIGIDLGTQRQVANRTKLETEAAQGQQAAQAATEGGGQSGQQGSAGGSANFAAGGRGV